MGEKKLSDGKTIGGKGRLTDAIISKLTTFYGNAIRANSHNVNEMRQAVWAVWAHTSSTDDEPKHWFCPKGKNSWFSGDGTWKTRGHTSLIGVCALIGADCGKVLDMEVMSSYCKGCDSYKGPKFGPKYSAFLAKHQIFCRKNHSGSAGGMEV
ncbi:uncharacterized protein TNCV_1630731 [Trichonephila clavipes]|nr:uncharacterized protein TNCV_1630731 [Trichonephila clavipes]